MMEVHYCKSCRSRVSSFDIEAGQGKLVGRDAYCRRCAKKLEEAPVSSLTPGRRQTPAKQISAAMIKKRSANQEPETSITRVVQRRVVQKTAAREHEFHPAPQNKKSSAASIIFAFLFLGVVAGLAYGLYYKKYLKPKKTGTQEKNVKTTPSDEKTEKQVKKDAASVQEKKVKPAEEVQTKPGKPVLPRSRVVIAPNTEWRYLAGTYATGSWTEVEYDDSSWKTGIAGFGYGDDDDQTVLKDMEGNYTIVYIRKHFTIPDPETVKALLLKIKYDDGFVAYINTREVARSKVKGAEKNVKVNSHESKRLEMFPVKNLKKILKKGLNVLAIEGHNKSKGSSDFTLDPYLEIAE